MIISDTNSGIAIWCVLITISNKSSLSATFNSYISIMFTSSHPKAFLTDEWDAKFHYCLFFFLHIIRQISIFCLLIYIIACLIFTKNFAIQSYCLSLANLNSVPQPCANLKEGKPAAELRVERHDTIHGQQRVNASKFFSSKRKKRRPSERRQRNNNLSLGRTISN